MTLAGIPVTATSANGPPSVPRRSGGYAPTVWSNEFIQSLNSQFPDAHANRHGELMEKTRNMLSECNEHLSLIKLLDWLQKLGVAYHFKDYIYKLLGDLSNHMTDILEKGDLNHISILFVLLRNNGFVVSQDIFKGFFDQENQLSIMKCNDYRGILSLYEASFLSYDGEVILNNVRELCIEYLKNLYEETTIDTLKETIKRSLEIPLHRRIMRLEIHQFIKMYAMEKDMSPVLLEFSQLDYNKVQCVHMDEVKRASRWWDEIGFKGNIQFFRDRIVECWIWAIGIASHEPKSSYCREHLTKLTALIALLDDLYDIYGTMDEIEVFTQTIERWTIHGIEELPHYMKIIFLALFNYVNELSYELLRDKNIQVSLYLQRLVLLQCKAYYTEAKWYHSGYIPSFSEYMKNVVVSSGAPVLLGYLYCLGCDNISFKTIEELIEIPSLVRNASIVGRLIDDIVTSKVEQERGDVPKAIECYMHQEKVDEYVSREHATQIIETTWKVINKERFTNPFSEDLITNGALGFAQTCHCFYQHGDGFSSPSKMMEEHVKAFLVEHISII